MQISASFSFWLNDLTGEVGFGLGPKDWVDAERLDVDTLLIHHLSAFRRDHERGQLHLQPDQCIRLGDMAVGVHVDGPNAASIDDNLAPPLWLLRQRGTHHATPAKRDGRQGTSSTAEHFSTVCRQLHSPHCP
jgi:hypothetical protein